MQYIDNKIYIRKLFKDLTKKQIEEMKRKMKHKGFHFVAIQGSYMIFEANATGINRYVNFISPDI